METIIDYPGFDLFCRLNTAIWSGNIDEAKQLTSEGALNFKLTDELSDAVDACIDPPLDSCIQAGRLEIMKSLIEAGADLNECYNGMRPLEEAIHFQNFEAFNLLLKAGADIRLCNDPLHLAAEAGCLEIVSQLLSLGYNPTRLESVEARLGKSSIDCAVKSGHLELAKMLIDWTEQKH